MPIQAPQAQGQQPTPYAPSSIEPLVFDTFEGLNTSPLRVGVNDKQAYWIDGFMPIDYRNARTLYDLGPSIFTIPGAPTVVFFEFYNLLGTPYMIVFLSDGSAVQVNINTQVTTTILPASTILVPTIINVGVSQWGQQYLIIVANQTNGYWVWDGGVLYTAGTLAPVVTLTNAGSNYTTAPNIVVSGGTGMNASLVAQISNGLITGVSVAGAGTGYLAGQSVTLTFSGGQTSGTGGSVVVFLTSSTPGSGAAFTAISQFLGVQYDIPSISVISHGSGYSPLTQMVASFVPGQQQVVLMTPNIANGSIVSVNVVNPGLYNINPTSFGINISASDTAHDYISSVSIVAAGTGYSPNLQASLTGGVSVISQGAIQLFETGGNITSSSITSPGFYGTTTAPTVVITDTPVVASATATLMPFGISGTSVETYVGYVWVVNGNVLYNSAPGSVSDFNTGDGGGNKTSNSSQLRVGYKRLKQSNGFLYTIADSSIDVVSGVQTSGTLSQTTYSWLNADPETGTPFPEAVIAYDRGLMFANPFGIHVMYGNTAKKISEPLDGVYTTVPNFGSLQLSLAEHTIFSRKCAVALVPIVDPVKNVQVNKLFCFDGKRWFASEQGRKLTYIKHQEINSSITCYGTDGSVVAPLFTTPSVTFTKTIQSKLWDTPGGIQYDKGTSRFWSLWNYNSSVSTNFSVTIDSLNNLNAYSQQTITVAGPSPTAAQTDGFGNAYVDPLGNLLINTGLMGTGFTGFWASPPQAIGQQGVLVGMTLHTNCPDVQLASAVIQPELDQYRG